jgi:hypothetical protein
MTHDPKAVGPAKPLGTRPAFANAQKASQCADRRQFRWMISAALPSASAATPSASAHRAIASTANWRRTRPVRSELWTADRLFFLVMRLFNHIRSYHVNSFSDSFFVSQDRVLMQQIAALFLA